MAISALVMPLSSKRGGRGDFSLNNHNSWHILGKDAGQSEKVSNPSLIIYTKRGIDLLYSSGSS